MLYGEVESQFTMNNNRNNQKEEMLKELGESIGGLREELQQGRINNQKLQENQGKMEQNGRRKVMGEAMQKNTSSVQTQEGRRQGWIRSEQTNVYQNSITEPKRSKKGECATGINLRGGGSKVLRMGRERNDPTLNAIWKIPNQ